MAERTVFCRPAQGGLEYPNKKAVDWQRANLNTPLKRQKAVDALMETSHAIQTKYPKEATGLVDDVKFQMRNQQKFVKELKLRELKLKKLQRLKNRKRRRWSA